MFDLFADVSPCPTMLAYSRELTASWHLYRSISSCCFDRVCSNSLANLFSSLSRACVVFLTAMMSSSKVINLSASNCFPSCTSCQGSWIRVCNLLLSIARFPEGDPAILKGQGGQVSKEISTRDITKVRD